MTVHYIPDCSVSPVELADSSCLYELVGANGVTVRTNYSIAKTVLPRAHTALLHYHRRTEEIYIVTKGAGRVAVDRRVIDVAPGDTLVIEPGAAHCAMTSERCGMEFFAISVPAYSDTDFLVGNSGGKD